MSKAYDRVEWVFLVEMMRRMEFPEPWIRVAMDCISNLSLSCVINDEPCGKINPVSWASAGLPTLPLTFFLYVQKGFRGCFGRQRPTRPLRAFLVRVGAPKLATFSLRMIALFSVELRLRNVPRLRSC